MATVRASGHRPDRSRPRLAAALATLALAAHQLLAADQPSRPSGPTPPTFNDDVAPILSRRCASCHRPGQPAPMPLLSYAAARPWARAIRDRVMRREMPPWNADPRFGRFANDPTLTERERQVLAQWAESGAPEGSGPPVAISAPDQHWSPQLERPPDLVVEMPAAIDVPPGSQWPTLNVYSTSPHALRQEDRFVEAVQLLPGNRRVTHHSSLSTRVFPPGVSLGRARPWPGGPLVDGLPVLTDRAQYERAPEPLPGAAEAFSSAGVSHLTYYFPGNDGLVIYPATAGKRLPAGRLLEWSVHYTPAEALERDRHRAAIWLHRTPPAHEVITLRVGDFHIVNGREVVLPAGIRTNPGHAAIVDAPADCAGRPCTRPVAMLPPIPAGARNWRITAVTPFLDDVTVYSLSPHGHYRLAAMTYVVTYPDGREATLLSVPRYDFNWQFVYRLAEPLPIPAGSTIKAVGHYDNSADNELNPDPRQTVQWGEQSSDEMFNGFLDLSVDRFARVGSSSAPAAAPTRPLVIAAGCATRRPDGTWWLDQATPPARSAIVHADAHEVATTRRTSDRNLYRLLGSADFAAIDDLLAAGARSSITTPARANATGQLAEGRSVGVKGVLIGGAAPAINLVSVWPLPGSCGPR